MAKVKVPQADGEIRITHLGDPKVYAVSKNMVNVAEEDLEDFLIHVDGSVAVEVSDAARKDAAAAAAADEKQRQADDDAAAAAKEQNDQAVADANAEAAARAANELRTKMPKPAKTTASS